MFAMEHWDVKPDIFTMAKGLTSGYAPLGAVAMKREIFDYFKEKTFFGGMTYTGHPVSCAAAIANIEVLQQEKLVENSAARGETLKQLLQEIKAKHHSVGDVRSIGLFGVIELVRNTLTREPFTEPDQPLKPAMAKVKAEILKQGVFMYNTFHMLLIIPPLIITDDQLREGFAVIDKALELADAELAPEN